MKRLFEYLVILIIIGAGTLTFIGTRGADYLLPTQLFKPDLTTECLTKQKIEKKLFTSFVDKYACFDILAQDGLSIAERYCFRKIFKDNICQTLVWFFDPGVIGDIIVIRVKDQNTWIEGDSGGTPEQKQEIIDILND